jgi:hypothetical protein
VLGDASIIHHVEECMRKRTDQRAFQCCAFSKDPSNLHQIIFLTLTKYEAVSQWDAQIHLVHPRGFKNAYMFKVIIHIDVVEDLMFYHYPREELIANGKVPWRDFT